MKESHRACQFKRLREFLLKIGLSKGAIARQLDCDRATFSVRVTHHCDHDRALHFIRR